MSQSGYGKEKRLTGRVSGSLHRVNPHMSASSFSAHSSIQETISYRDSLRGEPVLDKDIDPYASFIRRAQGRKREAYLSSLDSLKESVQSSARMLKTPMSDQQWSTFVEAQKAYNEDVADNGHAFLTRKSKCWTSLNGSVYYYPDNLSTQYRGGPVEARGATVSAAHAARMPYTFQGSNSTARRTFGPETLPEVPSMVQLDSYGKRAINTLAPDQPDLNVVASVGELFLGFPKLPFAGLAQLGNNKLKAAGDEFLNYMFGINPTVKDMDTLARTLNEASQKLFQLRRDNGRPVRRRMTFPVDTKIERFSGLELQDQGYARINAPGYERKGPSSTEQKVAAQTRQTTLELMRRQEISFSGSFSYFLPVSAGLVSNYEKYGVEWERLLSFDLNAPVVWQLTPWSWLIDWFIDIGSSLELLEKAYSDSLVMNYGYLMRSTKYTARQTTSFTYDAKKKSSFSYVSSGSSTEIKERIRANPYGFITPTELRLSPDKWAITAALAFSQGRYLN